MAKQVTSNEIYENNIFSNLKKETQEQIELIDKLDAKVIDFSKHLKESVKGLKFDNSKDFQTLSNAMESSNKMTKEAIQLEKDMANLRKVNAQATVAETRAQEAQAKATARQTRETQKLNSAYKQESARLNELRNKYKDLAIQNKTNTKEARAMLQEITKLDAKLKSVDATVGQNQRSVGNYSKAIGGLRNGLMQLGVSFGVFQIAKGGIGILKSFDEEVANMAKTLNVSKEEARGLANELLKIDTRTSVEELQRIAVIGGQIGITKDRIVDFTKAMDILNVSLGDEFTGGAEEITNVLGALRNNFSDIKTQNVDDDLLHIGNALNELGAKGLATAPVVSEFASRISGVGIPLGATTGQILGVSASLQELGVSSERGGTAISGLFKKMASQTEGFSKLAGMTEESFRNLVNTDIVGALQAVAKGTQKYKGNASALAKELDNLQLDGAGATEVLLKLGSAEELVDDRIKLATDSLQKQDSILAENEKKQETLGAKIEKLGKSFDTYVLGIDEAGMATGAFGKVIDFLAGNLGSIISWITKLGALYLVFIARQKILNTELVKGFKGVGSFKDGLKGMVTNLKEGASAGTGLGGALKGIGWTALIGLAVEFATELYNIASGAKLAEYRMQQFEKASQLGMEKGRERAEKFSKALKKEMQAIDLMNVSDEKKNQLRQKAIAQNKEAIKQKIIQLQQAYQEAEAQRKIAYEEEKRLEKNQLAGFVGSPQKFAQELAFAQRKVTDLQSSKVAYSKAITELRGELEGLGDQTHGLVVEQNELVKSTDNNVKADKKQAKATQEKKKVLKEYNDELTQSQELLDNAILDRGLENATQGVNDAIEQQLKNVEQTGTFNLQMIYDQIDAEDELQKKIIERTYLQDLANATNQADRDLAEFKRTISLEDLENETLNQKKQILTDLNDAQENYKGNIEDTSKAEEDALKKKQDLAQAERDLAKMLADYLIEQSNRTIEQLDKQIANAEKNADYLQTLAENGNIKAEQSYAKEQEIIREANLQKQKELQRQQRIKLAETVFSTYNTKLNNPETSKNALSETIKDVSILEAFINSLPKFYHGTEDTGSKGALFDQYGAITGVTHSNERVFTADHNKELKGLSNENVVDIVKLHNQLGSDGFKKVDGFDVAGKSMDLVPIIKELAEVKKAIQNQPTTDYNFDKIVRGVAVLIKEEKRGNVRITTKNRLS